MNAILLISIFIVSILIFAIIFIHKSKVKEHINLPNNEVINSNYPLPNSIKLNDECNILIDQTKVTEELNNLPEITDSKILKKINVLIPHVLDASRNLTQTQQLLDAGKQIKDFNASIPKKYCRSDYSS